MASALSAMRRPFSRMGVRDRLLLAVLVTVAVALVSMTVAFNLVLVSTPHLRRRHAALQAGPGREPA